MTAKAAKARAVVRLPDGRTGRLLYWPIPDNDRISDPFAVRRDRHTRGARARVELPGGAIVSVDLDDVTIVEPVVSSQNKAPSRLISRTQWSATSTECHQARSTNVQEMT